jgi:CsoR family transcriptional regulator, copper-sensing transcriptional repressor
MTATPARIALGDMRSGPAAPLREAVPRAARPRGSLPWYGIPGEATIDEDTKAKAFGRLRRIEGQVKGIQRMIQADQDGADVLLQLSAVQGAMAQVQRLILSEHAASCVTEAMRFGSGRERQRRVEELLEVFSRFSGR